jgi:DNA-dependent protein kinase catalytic subunit
MSIVNSVVSEEDQRLVARLLAFLGQSGGDARYVLDAHDDAHLSLAWDSTPRIKFALPFEGVKLDLYLDSLLPILCELAEKETNRRTKVAACEALHAVIIYMVFKGSQDPNRMNTQSQALGGGNKDLQFAVDKLYSKLFPVMVRLAVDVEQVARQLFGPLVHQLIHWLTNNSKAEDPETMALLDTLTDALADPADGALREFAAGGIAEFFKWSMQQKQVGSGVANVESLLRRLYNLALHPHPYKRLGAALAFQHVYRLIRKEESFVSQHLLDILDHMLSSLAMAEHDDTSLGTKDQARKVVGNLERIVTDRGPQLYKRLNKVSQSRPRAGASHCASLETFTAWLFAYVGRREQECRRMCQHLFECFAPLCPNVASVEQWLERHFETHLISDVVSAFEGGGGADVAHDDPLALPRWVSSPGRVVEGMSIALRCESLSTWLDALGSALDCYHWSVDGGFVDATQALGQSSQILEVVSVFFSEVANARVLHDLIKRALPSTAQDLQRRRIVVCIRAFRLLGLLLNKHAELEATQHLLNPSLYTLMFMMLLRPSAAEFDATDARRLDSLQETLGVVCRGLVKQPPAIKGAAVIALQAALALDAIAPSSFKAVNLVADMDIFARLSAGYLHLWTADSHTSLLRSALGDVGCKTFAKDLCSEAFLLSSHYSERKANAMKANSRDSQAKSESENGDSGSAPIKITDRRRALSPLLRQVGQSMLHLSLKMALDAKDFFECLQDNKLLEVPNYTFTPP